MAEINVKFGENQRSIPAPATVADAIKAFDRDAQRNHSPRKLMARKSTNNADSEMPAMRSSRSSDHRRSRDGLEVLRHSTAHLLAAAVLELFPERSLVSARR
jgi:threonyl-tRNA synthetase